MATKDILDEKAIDIVKTLLPNIARVNGPEALGFDYAGICLDTRAKYSKKLVEYIQSGILDLTPVGHDHYHSASQECDWRGWNVGVEKRSRLAQMLVLMGDFEAVEKMRSGRVGRFSMLVICGLGSSIMSIPEELWKEELDAQAAVDPLISLKSGSGKPS